MVTIADGGFKTVVDGLTLAPLPSMLVRLSPMSVECRWWGMKGHERQKLGRKK